MLVAYIFKEKKKHLSLRFNPPLGGICNSALLLFFVFFDAAGPLAGGRWQVGC
jgi:hypothetical protein